MYIIGGSIYERWKIMKRLYNIIKSACKFRGGNRQFQANALVALASCINWENLRKRSNYGGYSNLNDSMHSDEKVKQIAEMHAKFKNGK